MNYTLVVQLIKRASNKKQTDGETTLLTLSHEGTVIRQLQFAVSTHH